MPSKTIAMKYTFLYLALMGLLFTSCSKDDYDYQNPNLLNVNVHFTVNLSLPQYSPLNFPANPVYVGGYGNGGIIIMNTGSSYIAFDASDPNHPVEQCSTLHIDGIKGVCQCPDHNTYNLFTGTFIEDESGGENLEFSMKQYQVIDNGNGVLTVTN